MNILCDAPHAQKNARDFCTSQRIMLRPASRLLLRPGLKVAEYFDVLREQGCFADARRVLAHVLPKRHALWWGCLCAWEAYRPEPPADVLEILDTAIAFVREPVDEQRRWIYTLGRSIGVNTLAGQLAMAVFCSGGSASTPAQPVLSLPSYVTGRLVGVVVYLASVCREPARYKERLQQFLELGLEIGRGENLWPAPREAVVEEPSSVLVQS